MLLKWSFKKLNSLPRPPKAFCRTFYFENPVLQSGSQKSPKLLDNPWWGFQVVHIIFTINWRRTVPSHADNCFKLHFGFLKKLCSWLRISDRRNHNVWFQNMLVNERPTCYLGVLGGRSIVSVANGSCEGAKNLDVLVHVRKVVTHHLEGIQR